MKPISSVHYTICPINPQAHLFSVRCRVDLPDPGGQVLELAAWIPGSYMIRDFARHIVRIAASCDDKPVLMRKLDKQTWRCEPCQGSLLIEYQVYAWDLSVRSAHLDTTHAYFNGTSVFLKVQSFQQQACLLTIERPQGDVYNRWKVATAMPVKQVSDSGFGVYQAQNYDELVDHPVEMGTFTEGQFDVYGIVHRVVITGRHETDMVRLCRDLKVICRHHIDFFKGDFPAPNYLFLITAVGSGYGGLEHRASTSLMCNRDDLPRHGLEDVDKGYRSFLGLCSHEYFHTWNVKRIQPRAFQPFDLRSEMHTRLLWIFEGITSYYDDLALLRSGIISMQDYLTLLAQVITRVWRTPGRFEQNLLDSSFDAWTKFYKQDENAANAIVSYYTKGALVALALDLNLRLQSESEWNLDKIMNVVWERHGKTGLGLVDGEFENIVVEQSGVVLDEFFTNVLHGTEDIPLQSLLKQFGVSMVLRASRSLSDIGGESNRITSDGFPKSALAITTSASDRGALLKTVLRNGAAQQAGLAAGDIVVAVNHLQVDNNNLEQRIAMMNPGQSVLIHAFRRDELMEFNVVLQPPLQDTCDLMPLDDVSSNALMRRADWLQIRS